MKAFMDEEFLLSTPTASRLYHEFAENMPVIDYHCHIDPNEILTDRRFDNITQVWLGGDHYKWRVMRASGVPEENITGSASDHDKFVEWAKMLPRLIGNPLYHWTHLELKRYFGYNGILNGDTAEEVWTLCNEKLATSALSVRGIIEQSSVLLICTTDDPADSLDAHKKLAQDASLKVKVLPAFRPDKAVNIDKAGFCEYIKKLSTVSGREIKDLDGLLEVLSSRLDLFQSLGCLASDHGLDAIVYAPASDAEVDRILKYALAGRSVSPIECDQYKTRMMLFFAREYARRGIVMQLHYAALRNANSKMFQKLGPDTGYDCIAAPEFAKAAAGFLDRLESEDSLPKTVIYSLNPIDNAAITTLMGCYQGEGVRGKLQHGAAWWFNDSIRGMRDQMENLASTGVLGNFIGMLTDSRSFLSYTRHEYFRRLLADMLGGMVERGEYPMDINALGALMQDISLNNAVNYFGFNI